MKKSCNRTRYMLRKRRLSQVFDSLETSTHSSSPDSDYITATSPSLLTEPTTTLSKKASST